MEAIKKKYVTPTTNVMEVRVDGAILTVSGDAPKYYGPYNF